MARTTKLSRSGEPAPRDRQVAPKERPAKQAVPAAPSLPNPTDPTLRAKRIRLPLPTLFYGPEGAVMSTKTRESIYFKVFKVVGDTPDSAREAELYRPQDHISLQTDSMVAGR